MIIISANPLLLKVQFRINSNGLITWALLEMGPQELPRPPRSASPFQQSPGDSGRSLRGSTLHDTDYTKRTEGSWALLAMVCAAVGILNSALQSALLMWQSTGLVIREFS